MSGDIRLTPQTTVTEAHPIRRLFDAGVRVTVNTDEPLMFGSGLSQEFLALYRSGLMTAAEFDAIRLEAFGKDDDAETRGLCRPAG